MQLLLHHALGADLGNTGNALQLVEQGVVQELGQLYRVHALHGYCRHFHRKHGGIDLHDIGGAHHVVPCCVQGGDILLDVHTDGVQIHRFLKFQYNHGIVFTGGGCDFLDVLQSGHGLLQGLCHLSLHLFGAGAGIGGHDHHIGEVHVGQQIRGHFQIGHHAQDQDGNHRHKNRQGLFYAEFGHTVLLTADTSAYYI